MQKSVYGGHVDTPDNENNENKGEDGEDLKGVQYVQVVRRPNYINYLFRCSYRRYLIAIKSNPCIDES